MLSVSEAIDSLLAGASALGAETIPISAVSGRVAAKDLTAQMTQPPFAASAMDGYAVRFEDAQKTTTIKVIGEAPAGAPFEHPVGAGEAVRIFTGGAMPKGADHVVIQEHVKRDGEAISIIEAQTSPRHIRHAGIDFMLGETLVKAGELLHQLHGSILAAANVPEIAVVRRPKIALFSNGDELIEPGAMLKPGQIVNSNHYALTAMMRAWGGEVTYLGCAADTEADIREHFKQAAKADIIMPIGGASVGDYDCVKPAFRALGGTMLFEKVAVRPGKPTWHGRLDGARVLGLPGNPASAIVSAALFGQALIRRLAGRSNRQSAFTSTAKTTIPLAANGGRESYLRAMTIGDESGDLCVQPVANQDSSLLSPFTAANVLIRRLVHAPAVPGGGAVDIIRLR